MNRNKLNTTFYIIVLFLFSLFQMKSVYDFYFLFRAKYSTGTSTERVWLMIMGGFNFWNIMTIILSSKAIRIDSITKWALYRKYFKLTLITMSCILTPAIAFSLFIFIYTIDELVKGARTSKLYFLIIGAGFAIQYLLLVALILPLFLKKRFQEQNSVYMKIEGKKTESSTEVTQIPEAKNE
jgi:hypothetical protein